MTLLGFERRWLVTIFEAIVPSGDEQRMRLGAKDVPMDRFVDDLLRHAPGHFILGLRACLWMVMLAPPFVLGRFRTFLGLGSDERLTLLERLGRSPRYLVRETPLLFKTIACLGFCGLPEVQSGLGIHPVDRVPPEWARPSLPVIKELR